MKNFSFATEADRTGLKAFPADCKRRGASVYIRAPLCFPILAEFHFMSYENSFLFFLGGKGREGKQRKAEKYLTCHMTHHHLT